MALNSSDNAQTFKMQVIDKIQSLLHEFAAGDLNREQFNALYERYSGQLALVQQVLESGNAELMGQAKDKNTTIALRQAHMGKAIGMAIYQNRTGMAIETLGDFEASPFVISPVLNDFTRLMAAGKPIEQRVEMLAEKSWLLFTGGSYTTVVTLFHNEPSPQQMREIERLHRDFETANKQHLEKTALDSQKLAYPFVVFVQKKLKRS